MPDPVPCGIAVLYLASISDQGLHPPAEIKSEDQARCRKLLGGHGLRHALEGRKVIRQLGRAGEDSLGDYDFDLATRTTPHPAPVTLPASRRISETEICSPMALFSSQADGAAAGSHFNTTTDALNDLPELGRKVLWEGARPMRFEFEAATAVSKRC